VSGIAAHGKVEALRHDARDGVVAAARCDRAAYDAAIRVEAGTPHAVAEQQFAGNFRGTAEHRRDSQGREEVRRDP
jgi:hypothetical protein